MTPSDGSKTWGRSAVCKKEDLTANKKKGRTWGPSSTHQRERVGGEEKYVDTGSFTFECFMIPQVCQQDSMVCNLFTAGIQTKNENCEMLFMLMAATYQDKMKPDLFSLMGMGKV